MKNNEVILGRDEYDELLADSHSLEMIFNLIEMKSYIDEDERFSILLDQDFINMVKAIDPEKINEIELLKREDYLKNIGIEKKEEIEQKEEKMKQETEPRQKEQINKSKKR